MRYSPRLALVVALLTPIVTNAVAQTSAEPSRGELLYTTHCVACHNARVHWREQKLATDWSSLRAQVRRFQGIQKLGWNNQDITEVARYLNTYYYNYPETSATK